MERQQPAARRPTPRSLATAGATLPVTFWRGGARGNIRARILWKFREDTEWTAAARCNFRIAKPCFTTTMAGPAKPRKKEERSVGNACVSKCNIRWEPYH